MSHGGDSASFFNQRSLRPWTTFKRLGKVAVIGTMGLMAATTAVGVISSKIADKQNDDPLIDDGRFCRKLLK